MEHVPSGQDATALYDSYETLFEATESPMDGEVSSLLARSSSTTSAYLAGTGLGRSATLGPDSVHHRSHIGLNGGTEVHVSQSRRITSRVTGTDSYAQLAQTTSSRTNERDTRFGVTAAGYSVTPGGAGVSAPNNGNGSSSVTRSYSEYEFSRNSTMPARPAAPQPPAPAPVRLSQPPPQQPPPSTSKLTQLVDIENELQTLTKSLEATYPSNNGGTATPLLQPNRPTSGVRPSVPVESAPTNNSSTIKARTSAYPALSFLIARIVANFVYSYVLELTFILHSFRNKHRTWRLSVGSSGRSK